MARKSTSPTFFLGSAVKKKKSKINLFDNEITKGHAFDPIMYNSSYFATITMPVLITTR